MLDIEWNDWGTDKTLPSLERFLASGGDVNELNADSGLNLLWLAAEQMDIPLIRRLGELGADPNRRLTSSGVTAMHNAVDIDIDSVMQSAQPGDTNELVRQVVFEVTKAMVEIGGSIRIADHSGKTPYDIAFEYHPQLGSKLLSILGG